MRILTVFCALTLLAGCSTATSSSTDDPAPAAAAPESTAVEMDAGTIVDRLKDADIGVTKVAVQDENTDPNNLIGRPTGYVSRASADLPGGDKDGDRATVARGLVVEVFATAEQAKARADYIKTVQQGAAVLGTEYHYVTGGGTALVRVSGMLKPSQAKKVEAAVAAL